MKPNTPSIAWMTVLALLAGCSQSTSDDAVASRPAIAQAAAARVPPAAATVTSPEAAAIAAQAVPPSDPDHPLPLPALQFKGAGTGKAESRYYAFDAGAGTITVTATAKNSASGATQALGFALYDLAANRLCFDSHGNTTQDKTVVLTCNIDKAQPLLLRLDLSPESLDYAITLAGPVTIPTAKTISIDRAFAGAGSTDIDAPTHLSGNRIQTEGPGKPVSYYYAFNAGPGELTLIGDGRNTSAATTDALQLTLYTARSERICSLSLGNTTLDKRVITSCPLDKRQPVVLRADLSAETVAFRARFDGPFDFEPYTPPAVVTIALDASVLFDTGKSALKSDARTDLHEAAQRVKKFAGASVLISGHTDNVGSTASNRTLSEHRATAVKEYFVTQEGIEPDTLTTKGFGSTQPVDANTTDAGRARNRRVDVVITPTKR